LPAQAQAAWRAATLPQPRPVKPLSAEASGLLRHAGWEVTAVSNVWREPAMSCGKKRRMRKKIVEPIFDVLEVIYRILLEMDFFFSPNTFSGVGKQHVFRNEK
jgi:hypothetical protein